MAGLSKFCHGTLPYNCYELGHTWSPSCFKAIHMLGSNAVVASAKLYVVFYLADFLIKRQKINASNIKSLTFNILQSTTYLGVTGYMFLLSVCGLRHILGHFNIYTAAFVPGLISSISGILIERRNRRCALTLYVANVACETLFLMLKARKIIKPLPNGEVFLFSCSMAIYMYQLRKYQSQDIISKFLKYFFAMAPPSTIPKTNGVHKSKEMNSTSVAPNGHLKQTKTFTPKHQLHSLQILFTTYWGKVAGRLQSLPRSPCCNHLHSCIYSTLCGFIKAFGLGYVTMLALGVLPSVFNIMRNPQQLKKYLMDRKNFRQGLFFGSFVSIFKAASCFLRWLRKSDDPIHNLPAGFLAGLSMYFYRNSTVALYAAWRVIEISYRTGMNDGYLPRWDAGVLLLYTVSTALLFHAAIVEPHNLKPAYFKFLNRVTGGLVGQINRRLLDNIGVSSSLMFPDYIPKLDKRFMTEEAIKYMSKLCTAL